MKRYLVLLLTVLMAFCFAACSGKGSSVINPRPDPDKTEVTAVASPEATAAATEAAPTAEPFSPGDLNAPACALEEYPKVDGSTANIPLAMGLIMAATGCTEDEAEESIAFSTTDYSYEALAEGRCDMLLVYEASAPTKEAYDPENNFDMRPIGLDALVFITNSDNPVDSLTVDQIRGIFSGSITNWSEVGGLDMPIKAFQRPTLSGSQTLMLDLCMGDVPMADQDVITVSDTMSDVIEDIAAYDNSANAIGYSVYYYAKNMYNQPNLKFIMVEGVEPTYESINTGDYPYVNPFYAILPKTNANPTAKALVDWLETSEGQRLVAACGYVPYLKS